VKFDAPARLAAIALMALAAAPVALGGRQAASRTRTVYVTALDDAAAPVLTLTAADFTVKEGGADRKVVSADLATAPMHISFIDDDNGSGIFRTAIAYFIQHVQHQADYSIDVLVPQPQRIVDFTSSFDTLSEALRHLGARPPVDGAQLLSGVDELAREYTKKKFDRGVFVVLSLGADSPAPTGANQFNTISPDDVLNHLQQSGASLNVFLVSSLQRPPSTGTLSQLDDNRSVNQVVGDGPRQSGGRHGSIVATAGPVKELQMLADELLKQYIVTYEMPDGAKFTNRINVGVKKSGVTLRAPTRVPIDR
jgi:hypothetical protein